MDKTAFLRELQKLILKKIGILQTYPGDCKNISHAIYSETNKYISETTLKRFFGFAAVKHNFSAFTLNTLCQFVGLKSWKDFISVEQEHATDIDNPWNTEKVKLSIVTDLSIRHIKNNSAVPFEYISSRNFISIDYQFFLESDSQIYLIVAPKGYGKSISLAQMASTLQESPNSESDIVLFLNFQVLVNSSMIGFEIQDWIKDKLGFGDSPIHIRFFNQHPHFIKGRLIIIMDGFDSSLVVKENASLLNDLFMELENSPWIRVVLSMRDTTWLTVKKYINKSEFLSSTYYKQNFIETNPYQNQPLLSEKEILSTISKIEKTNLTINDVHPQLLKQLSFPFWFNQFYRFRLEEPLLDLASDLFSYEMIHHFVVNQIYDDPNSTEIMMFLEKVASRIPVKKQKFFEKKQTFAPFLYPHIDIYNKVLELGIIKEEKLISNGLPIDAVSFTHDFLGYFLFRCIYNLGQEQINESTYLYIDKTYQNIPELRVNLLKWFVRESIVLNQYAALKNILTLTISPSSKLEICQFAFQILLKEINAHKSTFNKTSIGSGMLDFFVKSDLADAYYYEVINGLLTAQQNEDVYLHLLVIKAEQCINRYKFTEFLPILKVLKKNIQRLDHLYPINPYYLLDTYYKDVMGIATNFDIAAFIHENLASMVDQVKLLRTLTHQEVISYRLSLALLMYNRSDTSYKQTIKFLKEIHPNIWQSRNSTYVLRYRISLARIALGENNAKQAERIIQNLQTSIFEADSSFYNQYSFILYHGTKAEYYVLAKDYEKALEHIHISMEESLKSEYHLFVIKLFEFKISILRILQDSDQLAETMATFKHFKEAELLIKQKIDIT